MSRIPSLALQIQGHLNSGPLTADQLAAITGEDVFQIIDALTWMLGTEKIKQDNTPRYRLLKPGDSLSFPSACSPPERDGLQSPGFRG